MTAIAIKNRIATRSTIGERIASGQLCGMGVSISVSPSPGTWDNRQGVGSTPLLGGEFNTRSRLGQGGLPGDLLEQDGLFPGQAGIGPGDFALGRFLKDARVVDKGYKIATGRREMDAIGEDRAEEVFHAGDFTGIDSFFQPDQSRAAGAQQRGLARVLFVPVFENEAVILHLVGHALIPSGGIAVGGEPLGFHPTGTNAVGISFPGVLCGPLGVEPDLHLGVAFLGQVEEVKARIGVARDARRIGEDLQEQVTDATASLFSQNFTSGSTEDAASHFVYTGGGMAAQTSSDTFGFAGNGSVNYQTGDFTWSGQTDSDSYEESGSSQTSTQTVSDWSRDPISGNWQATFTDASDSGTAHGQYSYSYDESDCDLFGFGAYDPCITFYVYGDTNASNVSESYNYQYSHDATSTIGSDEQTTFSANSSGTGSASGTAQLNYNSGEMTYFTEGNSVVATVSDPNEMTATVSQQYDATGTWSQSVNAGVTSGQNPSWSNAVSGSANSWAVVWNDDGPQTLTNLSDSYSSTISTPDFGNGDSTGGPWINSGLTLWNTATMSFGDGAYGLDDAYNQGPANGAAMAAPLAAAIAPADSGQSSNPPPTPVGNPTTGNGNGQAPAKPAAVLPAGGQIVKLNLYERFILDWFDQPPTFCGSMVPVVGSLRQSVNAYADGHWIKGTKFFGLAVADCLLVGSVAKGLVKSVGTLGLVKTLTPGFFRLTAAEGGGTAGIHFVWDVAGEITADSFHAIGKLFRMQVTTKGAINYIIEHAVYFQREFPVLSRGLAQVEGIKAWSCFTAALNAYSRGWYHVVPYFLLHATTNLALQTKAPAPFRNPGNPAPATQPSLKLYWHNMIGIDQSDPNSVGFIWWRSPNPSNWPVDSFPMHPRYVNGQFVFP